MTKSEIKEYISSKLDWIDRYTNNDGDLEAYYEIVDNFQSDLINNPPTELRVTV